MGDRNNVPTLQTGLPNVILEDQSQFGDYESEEVPGGTFRQGLGSVSVDMSMESRMSFNTPENVIRPDEAPSAFRIGSSGGDEDDPNFLTFTPDWVPSRESVGPVSSRRDAIRFPHGRDSIQLYFRFDTYTQRAS